ncbi:hypothetical protein KP509_30G032500 [Ceratopteris richardii]|uniref:Uncharacterized protein n=1 Tax=Ceratopteris richardii TaxID=49495 RepID=A0A8T2R2U2_CERRI|nr:hypothetical protein KP509_30G032500 [Ceratopteris richardii]
MLLFTSVSHATGRALIGTIQIRNLNACTSERLKKFGGSLAVFLFYSLHALFCTRFKRKQRLMRGTKTVTLVSEDGLKFVIEWKAAMTSPTLTKMIMLHGKLDDLNTTEVRFLDVSSAELETLCQCLFTYCLE